MIQDTSCYPSGQTSVTKVFIKQNSYREDFTLSPLHTGDHQHGFPSQQQQASKYNLSPILMDSLRGANFVPPILPSPLYSQTDRNNNNWYPQEAVSPLMQNLTQNESLHQGYSPRFTKPSTFDEVFSPTPNSRTMSLESPAQQHATEVKLKGPSQIVAASSPASQKSTPPTATTQPQQYTEYSFISHNSKGKRGRRKKSVTIFSTHNPFGGTFVDECTSEAATTPTRQYTNIPNTMFTTYTPAVTSPAGVSKVKTKPKSTLKLKTATTVQASPTFITTTSTTLSDEIILKDQESSSCSTPSSAEGIVKTPIYTNDMIAFPGNPQFLEPDAQKHNHNKLRRVSIKNLLC
ncbi:hypothetical protein AKO1_006651 [Acrasis kona]|uniref:Uncharacterized protein n=1 Tax=Acrasis kona TaxID=1008807 RepID=A0AAW2ZNA2_9EUKA